MDAIQKRYVLVVRDEDGGTHEYPMSDETSARELARTFENWGARTEIRCGGPAES